MEYRHRLIIGCTFGNTIIIDTALAPNMTTTMGALCDILICY